MYKFYKYTIIFIVAYSIEGTSISYSKNNYKTEVVLDAKSKLKKVSFNQLDGWNKEDFNMTLKLFLLSCERFSKFSEDKKILPQINKNITRKDLNGICKIAKTIKEYESKHIKVFFEKFFIPYEVISDKSLFTGYYIPIIKAKRSKDMTFKYPIYKRPPDLTDDKYYTRRQINFGTLNNKNLEIFYTNDAIELFFLHIQGSGIVRLIDENKTVYIGYDGKNNHKYSSLWNHISNKGLIDKNTKRNAKTIKYALRNSKNNINEILNMNDSYIFLKILKENTVKGSFGTELIPQRTMAIDKNYIPLGFLLWVDTVHNLEHKNISFKKAVLANDVGSAINGAIRGDIFFGYGSDGENNASYQYSEGKYYLLIPKKIAKKL